MDVPQVGSIVEFFVYKVMATRCKSLLDNVM